MIIKKYVVENMNEAIVKIKEDLGAEAVIIGETKKRKKGFKGLLGKKVYEVTAVLETTKEKKNKSGKGNMSFDESLDFLKKIEKINKKEALEIEEEAKQEAALNKEETKISEQFSEMKQLLNKVIQNTETKEDEFNMVLNEMEIGTIYYDEIKSGCNGNINDLKNYLSKSLDVCKDELNGVVALVGPTGVGKTTTTAKLAGRLLLKEKKTVGLITIDSYRLGAITQIEIYGEILNIPCKTVTSIKQMSEAIESLSYLDVILVDTTGRSSKNDMEISELNAYLSRANPDHTILVISSTTKNNDIINISKGYSKLKFNKVIITKLDETNTFGSIYTICKETKVPIAYVTTGQVASKDILIPSKDFLLNLMLGEEEL